MKLRKSCTVVVTYLPKFPNPITCIITNSQPKSQGMIVLITCQRITPPFKTLIISPPTPSPLCTAVHLKQLPNMTLVPSVIASSSVITSRMRQPPWPLSKQICLHIPPSLFPLVSSQIFPLVHHMPHSLSYLNWIRALYPSWKGVWGKLGTKPR
uniref:Uncharacterized protein n=1 Tax=Cacopsylla melanoneura TaxID=428564 RepID=A0A8D8YGT4_9HEMI